MPLAARLEAGSLFAGDFRVIDLLAEGGMSTLYRVEQQSTHKLRALKLVHARIAADPKGRQRFVREATVGAAIASEHVVEVIAAGIEEATDQPWLAMELLDGADLGSLVEHRGPLSPSQALVVLRQLCHGLGAAHRAGVVHRDLKPANIFVARSLRSEGPFTVKILDFGIAKLVEAGKSGATETETVGSPMWMAPEQLNAQRPTPATDIWALGLIAFWALTGQHYWRAAHLRDSTVQALFVEQLFKPLDPASERAAELGVGERLPDGFDAWFRRCVVREPVRRFADAEAAIVGLAEAIAVPEPALDLGEVLPRSPVPPSTSAAAAAIERGPTWAAGATQRDVDDGGTLTRPSSAGGDPTLGADEPLGADLSRADLGTPEPAPPRAAPRSRAGLLAAAIAVPALLGGGLLWAFTIGPLASTQDIDAPGESSEAPTDDPAPTPEPDPVPPLELPTPEPPIPTPDPEATAPAVELVVPQREQPSFAARDVRMLGWTADSRRFVLQATHGEEASADGSGDDVLELVQVHDTLTGAMVESYVVGRAARLRGRHLGRLRRLSEQAKSFAEWEARKDELSLQPVDARHAPPRGATLEIETDEAPPPTAIAARATDRGFLFRWDGVPALVPMGDERARGPHMRTILLDGDARWELLDIRPPFTLGELAARADASGATPALVGRIDMFWSPDERRVVMLTEAGVRPAGEGRELREARWFLRAAGPQIRIVEAGAGQRLARQVARALETAGLPTAVVDLREPVVEHSEIYVRRGWPGALELGARIETALERDLSIEEVKNDGWTTAVVVLGHDLAE
jgi:serine/threonine protein kinase